MRLIRAPLETLQDEFYMPDIVPQILENNTDILMNICDAQTPWVETLQVLKETVTCLYVLSMLTFHSRGSTKLQFLLHTFKS